MAERAQVYRLLVVEDESRLRELCRSLLETQGYQVECAEDGLEGLAALMKAVPDMILSDLQMPNMNGYEFLAVVRQRFPAVPVIVISGEFGGTAVPGNVLADAYFSKGSYKLSDLLEKIGELLAKPLGRLRPAQAMRSALDGRGDRELLAAADPCCVPRFLIV